jgi:hypothetical protein
MISVGNVPFWVWLLQEYESPRTRRWMQLNHSQPQTHILAHQSASLSIHIHENLFQNIYNWRPEKNVGYLMTKAPFRLPFVYFDILVIYQWTVPGLFTVSGTWKYSTANTFVKPVGCCSATNHSEDIHTLTVTTAVTLYSYIREVWISADLFVGFHSIYPRWC